MKVETPQIRWHVQSDDGKNAPVYSISMLESGICQDNHVDDLKTTFDHVVATCGNTNEIHLWTATFGTSIDSTSSSSITNNLDIDYTSKSSPRSATKITHKLTLARHERSVNCVQFSPDGLHLATAGGNGSIIVWSVPLQKRGNGNGRHYWSTVEKPQNLICKILSTQCEDISDLSWSADSKRFAAASLDHAVLIFQLEEKYEPTNSSSTNDNNIDNQNINDNDNGDSSVIGQQWRCAYNNRRDHTHYVQGVAYDPLSVYVASMGSDRTVRIYPRKKPPQMRLKKNKDKTSTEPSSTSLSARDEKLAIQQMLTASSKLIMGKTKTLKYRESPQSQEQDGNGSNGSGNGNGSSDDQGAAKKHYLFADESTVESFFRRLDWTTDGAFLITPAAALVSSSVSGNDNISNEPTFGTYLWARHQFDQPYKVLPGLDKPSVVVRANPVLFQLPQENCLFNHNNSNNNKGGHHRHPLAYRSIFCVLTLDAVLIYDTFHNRPLCVARGLHYSGLTDCAWSADGHHLMVTSNDGYVSMLHFGPGELGDVYKEEAAATVTAAPTKQLQQQQQQQVVKPTITKISSPLRVPMTVPLPDCDKGETASIVVPPTKRVKFSHDGDVVFKDKKEPAVVPVEEPHGTKRPMEDDNDEDNDNGDHTNVVVEKVTHLSLNTASEQPNNKTEQQVQKKKKKRIAPTLISVG